MYINYNITIIFLHYTQPLMCDGQPVHTELSLVFLKICLIFDTNFLFCWEWVKHLVLVFKGGKFKVHFLKFRFFITHLSLNWFFFSSHQCGSGRNATCQPADSIAISFISLLQDESNFWKGKIQDCITSRKSENIKAGWKLM